MDGTINVEDTYTKWWLIEAARFRHLEEVVSGVQKVPEPIGIEEAVQKFNMMGFPVVSE